MVPQLCLGLLQCTSAVNCGTRGRLSCCELSLCQSSHAYCQPSRIAWRERIEILPLKNAYGVTKCSVRMHPSAVGPLTLIRPLKPFVELNTHLSSKIPIELHPSKHVSQMPCFPMVGVVLNVRAGTASLDCGWSAQGAH